MNINFVKDVSDDGSDDCTRPAGAVGAVEEDADEESSASIHLNFADGFVSTKRAALTAIGALAKHTDELFFPYLESTIKTILDKGTGTVFSFHPSVRSESVQMMSSLLRVAFEHYDLSTPATGGMCTLPPDIAALCNSLVSVCVGIIATDPDKQPVEFACEQLGEILDLVGVAALMGETDEGTHLRTGLTTY